MQCQWLSWDAVGELAARCPLERDLEDLCFMKDCVPTFSAPPHFMPLPLLQRQRGRDGERENCLLLPLSIGKQLSTPPPPSKSNKATAPLDLLLSPLGQQTNYMYPFSCGGKAQSPNLLAAPLREKINTASPYQCQDCPAMISDSGLINSQRRTTSFKARGE
ncbi:hypothetical protein GBF38_014055 [Nibea albiflora]|uniref:Uncharacterized protein n=1 Tax=Nibea albiflora TaxID=240163 RepID=A0ACB7F6D0_NIBAL|nr:hypothetical protein GBF38_014055 [Nibea albiflora]